MFGGSMFGGPMFGGFGSVPDAPGVPGFVTGSDVAAARGSDSAVAGGFGRTADLAAGGSSISDVEGGS